MATVLDHLGELPARERINFFERSLLDVETKAFLRALKPNSEFDVFLARDLREVVGTNPEPWCPVLTDIVEKATAGSLLQNCAGGIILDNLHRSRDWTSVPRYYQDKPRELLQWCASFFKPGSTLQERADNMILDNTYSTGNEGTYGLFGSLTQALGVVSRSVAGSAQRDRAEQYLEKVISVRIQEIQALPTIMERIEEYADLFPLLPSESPPQKKIVEGLKENIPHLSGKELDNLRQEIAAVRDQDSMSPDERKLLKIFQDILRSVIISHHPQQVDSSQRTTQRPIHSIAQPPPATIAL